MALRVVIAAVFLLSTSVIAAAQAQVGQTEPQDQMSGPSWIMPPYAKSMQPMINGAWR